VSIATLTLAGFPTVRSRYSPCGKSCHASDPPVREYSRTGGSIDTNNTEITINTINTVNTSIHAANN
jgi:hypothetical protein